VAAPEHRASPGLARLGEKALNSIERVMRVMTHVNIGATIGMAAWILWSGHLVVSGQWTTAPGPRLDAQTRATGSQQPIASPCCLVPADNHRPEAL
jgi:hypothetical protein